MTPQVEARTRSTGGSTWADWPHGAIGAEPLEATSRDDAYGDEARVGLLERVRIARTPNTETHVVPSSSVSWRGSRWIIRSRTEARSRMAYELEMERTG